MEKGPTSPDADKISPKKDHLKNVAINNKPFAQYPIEAITKRVHSINSRENQPASLYGEIASFLKREQTYSKLPHAQRRFYKVVNDFPEGARDFITGLADSFMELDFYEQVRADKPQLDEIKQYLKDEGLDNSKINIVFNFFHLPVDWEKQYKK